MRNGLCLSSWASALTAGCRTSLCIHSHTKGTEKKDYLVRFQKTNWQQFLIGLAFVFCSTRTSFSVTGLICHVFFVVLEV